MTAVDAVVRVHEVTVWKLTMDLNAGYCWSHWPCCFSMISTSGSGAVALPGSGALVVKG